MIYSAFTFLILMSQWVDLRLWADTYGNRPLHVVGCT